MRPPALELGPKPVEPRLPDSAVALHELVQLPERLRAQGVQPAPPLGPHDHEVRVLQDGQLPRHPRLPDIHHTDQLVHRALAGAERLDDAAAGRVGQDLEGVGHARYITSATYVVSTICVRTALLAPNMRNRFKDRAVLEAQGCL